MQFESNGLQHTMSTIMVFQSNEYGRFKMISGNRQLNERKINRILKDITDGIDVLKYYPIQVFEKNKRLEIIDGQHRFYISKKLKRPVHYIMLQEDRSMPDIAKVNSNVEKWKTTDFINCYIEQGNNHYVQLKDFMDAYGMSVTISLKLLQLGSPGKEEGMMDGLSQEFQRGLFTVKFYNEAVALAELCKLFAPFKHNTERGFVIAISRIHTAGKIDVKELAAKYHKYPDMLSRQGGFKEYIFALEVLYNKQKVNRVVIY